MTAAGAGCGSNLSAACILPAKPHQASPRPGGRHLQQHTARNGTGTVYYMQRTDFVSSQFCSLQNVLQVTGP